MMVMKKKVHHIAPTMPSNRIKTTYFRFMPFIQLRQQYFRFDSFALSFSLLSFSLAPLSFALVLLLAQNNDIVFYLIACWTTKAKAHSFWADSHDRLKRFRITMPWYKQRTNPDYYYYEYSMRSWWQKREKMKQKRQKMETKWKEDINL